MFKYKISYCSFKSSSSKRIYCIPSQPAAGRSQSEVSSDSNNRITIATATKYQKKRLTSTYSSTFSCSASRLSASISFSLAVPFSMKYVVKLGSESVAAK